MKLLYGKPVADEILNRLKSEITLHSQKPGLAVILIGNNEASKIYVALKEKAAAEIGMNFFRHDLSENVAEDEVINLIKKLNVDEKIHGIIVQLPLPSAFNTEKIISAIDPKKDADGFCGQEKILQPVFPHAIALLIESSGEKLENKKAIVIANSDEFGQTMVSVLGQKGISAEYVISSEIQSNLGKIGEADIVASAVGSPGLLKGQMCKEGAIIVDGGIEKVDSKIFGDVDFASFETKNGFLTPVPGGVGPVTIACLLENTFLAFKAQQKEK